MKTILSILIIFISVSVIGQLTPANVVSPWSNATDYWHQQFAKLNSSDEYLEDSTDANAVLIDLKAPIAGPTFTGIVTAPTIETDSIVFGNGGALYNTKSDTLYLAETVVKITGDVVMTGHVTEGEHSSGQTTVTTPGTQTITTGGTFERMNGGAIAYTGDHLHDYTEDDGRLTYTRFNDISATVTWNISLESGETGQVVQIRIALNGTTIALSNQGVTFTNQNNNASVGGTRFVDISENDYIELFITSDTSSDDIIINNATLNVTTH